MAVTRVGGGAGNDAASGPTTSFSIAFPAGTQPGDLAVVTLNSLNTTVTVTTPAGWTVASGPDRSSSNSGWLLYRLLTAADVTAGSVTLSFSTSQQCQGAMEVIRGATTTGLLSAVAVDTTSDTSAPVPSLANVPGGAYFAVAFDYRIGATPAPDVGLISGYSQGQRVASNNGKSPEYSAEWQYKVPASTGTYGGETGTLATSGSNQTGVVYAIAFPASSSSTNATVAGPLATATAMAPSGSVATSRAATLAGPVSAVGAVAPAGSVSTATSVPWTGSTAWVGTDPWPGPDSGAAHDATIAGAVATAAATAPAGATTATRAVAVAGPVAASTATAPTGSVTATTSANVHGPLSAAAAVAPAGAVAVGGSVDLPGAAAISTATAPAGQVAAVRVVTVAGPTATAAALALAGNVQAAVSLAGVAAVATATAPAGSVTAGTDYNPHTYVLAPLAGTASTAPLASGGGSTAALSTRGASTAPLANNGASTAPVMTTT